MQQIGRFQILSRLGGGGFGEVFLAEDPAIGRQVAIKVFRPKDENLIAFATSSDDEGLAILRARFLNEAKILASLDHARHVVGVLEYGELDDGAPFYVMPYLPRSLADEIGKDVFDTLAMAELPEDQRPRAMPMERSLAVLGQLLDGLAAAHGRGLIHRDIKPANVMLTEDDEVRLVDFGIAKAPDGQHSTVSHLGMGSRNYMAPEQRESAKHVDARADVYAVGRLAYRLLTGRLPVGRFADPNVIVPALGQPLNDLILAALAEDREQRPTDARAFLERWQKAVQSVGQTESGSDTGTWVGDTGASDIRDELKPLRARIIEVLDAHGTIWPDEREALLALADIADLNEAGLDKLTEEVIAADENLSKKTRLARAVIQRVGVVQGPLSEKIRATLMTPTEACGWAEQDLDRLITRAVAEQRAAAQGNKATDTSSPKAGFNLPLKPILAGLLVIVVIAGSAFGIHNWRQGQIVEGERLALLEAARAEESQAWQQAETADSIEAYRQYLELWPEGGHIAEAETRITRLEDAQRQAQMSEAERQRELVSSIQDYLNRLGYRVPESGQLDTRTEAGIRAFEEAQELLVTGNADEVLQTALVEEYEARDQAAWQQATSTDTEAAYGSYREQFPQGAFLAEVDGRIEAARAKAAAEAERRRAAAAAEEQSRREAEAAAEAQRQLVRAVQTELKRLGRDVEIDGVAGDGTRNQILAFERATDRTQRGEASQAVLDAMKTTERWPGPQPGERFRDCDHCPEMVVIPAGSFQMGSPAGEAQRHDSEGPQRQVRVQAFALARTEATFAEWDACVDDGGCNHRPSDQGWGRGNRPVINVSWNDAQEYVRWLSRKTGQEYRLPSEAEREYATRAGTTSRFHTGNCITTAQANFDGNHPAQGCPSGEYRQRTVPVGSFSANAFGLHDMHGNVWEWVQDCWNDNYRGAPTDGSAWMSGDCGRAVLRGGSWSGGGRYLRSASAAGTPAASGATTRASVPPGP